MSIINFSIKNPLLINLSLLLVLIMGVLTWYTLPQEMFPVIELDIASINTRFEGASPAEVEQQVTLPIEEEFEDSQDIDHISSISKEGVSNIYIKLKAGTNVDDFMRDARTILDRIDDLPETADDPELNRLRTRFPVIALTLYGSLPQARLFKLAENVRRRMELIPGVASVGMAGDRDWEIWVVVDPNDLAALDIPLDRVMLALRNNLRDQPGGSIKSLEGDIRLRGKGVAPEPESIEEIVLLANANGGQLRLGDIAHVSRRFEEPRTYARFNGKPSVNLTVTKTASASTIEVSNRVHELAEELKQVLPASVNIGLHTDMSKYVKTRLNLVKSSGLVGLALVLVSLYFLLNFRVALITAFGIPFSFLVAIILLRYFGYTINMVSLFAFLIVLGMIVDDAIIITENVYRHIEMGHDNLHAATGGTREVFWPVVVSTLTTIAAFIPMFSIGSIIGEFTRVIPVVVSCALLGSLLEAFLVLPSHAAHFLKLQTRRRLINWKAMLNRYGDLLHWSASNRYTVAILGVALLAISLAYAMTRIPYEQFGDVELGQFFLNVETPNTYSLEESLDLTKKLERVILTTVGEDELDSLLANVGYSIIDFQRSRTGSNLIQFIVDLNKPVPEGFIEKWISPVVSMNFSEPGTRQRTTDEIINALRGQIMKFTGVKRLSVLKPQGGPAGNDIEIGVESDAVSVMQAKAEAITQYLRRMPGVHDVQNDQEPGKLEYKYALNDRGRRLGLTQSQLADVVRSGFLGNEVVHVTWNNKHIPVRVIYPEYIRRQSTSLTELPVVLSDGRMVYLGDVADISVGRGLNQIRRRNNQRMAKITAEVDSALTTPLAVTRQIENNFTPNSGETDYKLIFLGEKKDAQDAFSGMYNALVIALVVIFFMLAALFKSLLDPIVVMVAIPFGLIGVIIGHVIFNYHLQFLSLVGILALSGIIVNDSLILVDFVKHQRAGGLDRIAAVIEAGKVRARPILLTTITTFLGVSPLIFFSTGQTRFLAPMAVSLGFGLLFATVLILLALPCFYLIADDIRSWFYKWLAEKTGPKGATMEQGF
ncbi:MAG: efflux RND transporter permease subunit [Gammaproteobacteria bacterium]